MTFTPIPALPAAPARNEAPAAFVSKGNAFLGALPPWGSAVNEAGAQIQAMRDAAALSAAAAAASAESLAGVAGSVNFKGEWSDLTGPLAIPASASHDNKLWLLMRSLSDVTAFEPGVEYIEEPLGNPWSKLADLNSGVGSVTSVDDLKTVAQMRDGQVVAVGYHTNPAWGGGGRFVWLSDSEDADDGGSVIASTVMPAGRWHRLHDGRFTYADFGTDLSGDEYADAQIAACHAAANSAGVPVHQHFGRVRVEVQSSVGIDVRTDTDLSGLTVILDAGAGTTNLVYNWPRFWVIKGAAPIEFTAATHAGIWSDLQTLVTTHAQKMAHTFPLASVSGIGITAEQLEGASIYVETSAIDLYRNDASGPQPVPLVDLVQCGANGTLLVGFAKTLPGASLARIRVRLRENPLTFRAPAFEIDGARSLCMISVQRGQVDLSGVSIIERTTPPAQIRGFIEYLDVCDVTTRDLRLRAMRKTAANGTYGLYVMGLIDGRFENIKGYQGWGLFGSFFMKEVRFSDCRLNRIDVHFGAWNIWLRDCTLRNRGLQLQGGGLLSIRDCKYLVGTRGSELDDINSRVFVQSRKDYGGEWDGVVDIDGVVIELDCAAAEGETLNVSCADFGTLVDYDIGRDIYLPEVIRIRGVTWNVRKPLASLDTVQANFRMLEIKAAVEIDGGPEYSVYGPRSVTIEDGHVVRNDSPLTMANVRAYYGQYHDHPSYTMRTTADADAGRYNCEITVARVGEPNENPVIADLTGGLVTILADLSTAPADYISGTGLAFTPRITVRDCPSVIIDAICSGRVHVSGGTVHRIKDFLGTRTEHLTTLVSEADIKPTLPDADTRPNYFNAAQFAGCRFFPVAVPDDSTAYAEPVANGNSAHFAINLTGRTGYGNRVAGGAIAGLDYFGASPGFWQNLRASQSLSFADGERFELGESIARPSMSAATSEKWLVTRRGIWIGAPVARVNSTAYSVGQLLVSGSYVWVVRTAGTTGTTPPSALPDLGSFPTTNGFLYTDGTAILEFVDAVPLIVDAGVVDVTAVRDAITAVGAFGDMLSVSSNITLADATYRNATISTGGGSALTISVTNSAAIPPGYANWIVVTNSGGITIGVSGGTLLVGGSAAQGDMVYLVKLDGTNWAAKVV